MFHTCKNCGHDDYVHRNFVGECVHGQLRPKDGLDCDCPSMDFRGENK